PLPISSRVTALTLTLDGQPRRPPPGAHAASALGVVRAWPSPLGGAARRAGRSGHPGGLPGGARVPGAGTGVVLRRGRAGAPGGRRLLHGRCLGRGAAVGRVLLSGDRSGTGA